MNMDLIFTALKEDGDDHIAECCGIDSEQTLPTTTTNTTLNAPTLHQNPPLRSTTPSRLPRMSRTENQNFSHIITEGRLTLNPRTVNMPPSSHHPVRATSQYPSRVSPSAITSRNRYDLHSPVRSPHPNFQNGIRRTRSGISRPARSSTIRFQPQPTMRRTTSSYRISPRRSLHTRAPENRFTEQRSNNSLQMPPTVAESRSVAVEDRQSHVETQLSSGQRLRHVCVVCLDAVVDCIFLPCFHCTCCQQCANSLLECPICRSRIDSRHRVFF